MAIDKTQIQKCDVMHARVQEQHGHQENSKTSRLLYQSQACCRPPLLCTDCVPSSPQDIDSDEEWQKFAQVSDWTSQALLDTNILARLKAKLLASKEKVK